MSMSVNWATKVISVPQAYLTYVSGNTYKLDVDQFRLDLKALEDCEEGMIFPDTHRHNTEVTLGGITYARFVEIINGYTITFEDGQYMVNLEGANNNILDVANLNQVSMRSSNSAGLITVISGSGVTEQDKEDIIIGVWNESDRGNKLDDIAVIDPKILQILQGRWELDEDTCTLIYFDKTDSVPIMIFQLLDKDGNPSITEVYKRVPVL